MVSDNGDAMGIFGLAQNDSRFGTIRIAAKPMANNVLAIGIPPDPYFSGTWAGDIVFNTNTDFSNQNTDLYSIFLHEVGHALGLPDSDDPSSALFESAGGYRSGISAADVSALTALYGARTQDSHEFNDTLSAATRLQASNGWTGATPVVGFGEISTSQDVDYYQYQAPSGYSGATTFRVQSSGLSLLTAKVSLVDNKGHDIVSPVTSNLLGDTLFLRVPQTTPGANYYMRIERGPGDGSRIGRYAVAITLDSRLTTTESTLDSILRGPYDTLSPSDLDKLLIDGPSAFISNDAHSDDSLGTAKTLQPTPGVVSGTAYKTFGSFSDSADVDVYRVRAPRTDNGSTINMTINVTPMMVHGVVPKIQVYDRNSNVVNTAILANGDGLYVVQAIGLPGNADYFVRLENATNSPTGNYSLRVLFGAPSAALVTFVEGAVPAPGTSTSVYIAKPQLFHLLLSSLGGGVSVIIEGDNSTFTLTSVDGGAISSSVLLQPGEYKVTFVPTKPSAGSINVSLRGSLLSDPIGSVVVDPNLKPPYTNPDGTNTYPNGTTTTKNYLWLSLLV
ncbi:MAG: matrixin family metalloprotease [Gemmatales bacterium]